MERTDQQPQQPTPATHDPRVSVHALLHTLANHLDLEPNRPVDIHQVRGRARWLGATTDWAQLLPAPDTEDTPHSEYAARLREIAGPAL
jgi:hypothetical protein